jgi:hypothetical protein
MPGIICRERPSALNRSAGSLKAGQFAAQPFSALFGDDRVTTRDHGRVTDRSQKLANC